MAYYGLGNRLEMTGYVGGQSVTTQYALDNGKVLPAAAGELTTTYLYGLGPIGELTDVWNYSLPDGSNTPRQLVNAAGEVTLTSSYTPWGDTLSVSGTGSFTQGYFGGIMDTATGLLFVGNGQYYDPETGRFLNRATNSQDTNPYIPWGGNPSSALIAPPTCVPVGGGALGAGLLVERNQELNCWTVVDISLDFFPIPQNWLDLLCKSL